MPLSSKHLHDDQHPSVPDVRDSEWYQVVSEIRDLRNGGAHAWAEETLAAIANRIEQTQCVAAGQRRAIATIRASAWAPSRTYDRWGYGRRWR
jgi:hypothetical protein